MKSKNRPIVFTIITDGAVTKSEHIALLCKILEAASQSEVPQKITTTVLA